MQKEKYDVIVIGSGPSGQRAAIQARKLGKKVAVIERLPDIGGNCLYNGTIPSKTLREAILDLTQFHTTSFYGDREQIKNVNIKDLNHRLCQVIEEEKLAIKKLLQRYDIPFIEANAEFQDQKALILKDAKGEIISQISAALFFIATGSKPRNPEAVPFDDEVILDSTRLLKIHKVPKSMIILGGGVIGAEYGSFFSVLGTEVTLIDKKTHILPLLDSEIGKLLQKRLTELGLKFIGNVKSDKIWREKNRAFVSLDNGEVLSADVLLFAIGRTANVDGLKIENADLKTDEKGYIAVNDHFQTSVSHIYAVGDVIGGPCLASTSMEQGRLAAMHACKFKTHPFPAFFPHGIYTIPEISSFGHTEEELKALGFHYEVGRADYKEIAKSHITGSHYGMFKILFHKETLEILGIHIIGSGATEVIHIGQIVESMNGKLDFLVNHIFNYPTYAEGYRIAALDGLYKISKDLKKAFINPYI